MRRTGRWGRALGMAGAAVVIVLAAPAPAAASGAADGPMIEARVLTLVNGDRAALGLRPLALDGGAAARARDLAAAHRDVGRMVHTPLAQLAGWYMPPHVAAAELLAHAGATADAVLAVWLASDYHRALLRDPSFDLAGFGVAVDDDGTVWAVGHILDAPATPPPAEPQPAATGPAPSPAPPAAPSPTSAPDPPTAPASSAAPVATTLADGDADADMAADTVADTGADTLAGNLADSDDGGATTSPETRLAAAVSELLPGGGDGEDARPAVEDRPSADEPGRGFRPGLAAAVSAPTLAAAAAVRRRRRR